MMMMTFWRNECTTSFDVDGAGNRELQRILVEMRSGAGAATARAMESLIDLSILRLAPDARGTGGSALLVQEVCQVGFALTAHFVLKGSDRRVVGTTVGGGFAVSIEANGQISAEISTYFHRLVCTNGMTRKVTGNDRIAARDPTDWVVQLETHLPHVLEGIAEGFDGLGRSAEVRLGLLRPVVPVVLDYLGVKDPERGLILDALAIEPGDSLWHLVNAFSRAANMLMVTAGVEPATAMAGRRRLQFGALRICDAVLNEFTAGRSLLDVAKNLRESWQEERTWGSV